MKCSKKLRKSYMFKHYTRNKKTKISPKVNISTRTVSVIRFIGYEFDLYLSNSTNQQTHQLDDVDVFIQVHFVEAGVEN